MSDKNPISFSGPTPFSNMSNGLLIALLIADWVFYQGAFTMYVLAFGWMFLGFAWKFYKFFFGIN